MGTQAKAKRKRRIAERQTEQVKYIACQDYCPECGLDLEDCECYCRDPLAYYYGDNTYGAIKPGETLRHIVDLEGHGHNGVSLCGIMFDDWMPTRDIDHDCPECQRLYRLSL